MPLRPLLSLVGEGDPWPALNRRPGINPEHRNNFSDRLYKLATIEASGVPSLFSHPFVVYTKLNSGDGDTFNRFSTLIKGIFLGVISLRDVTDNLGQLYNVAKKVKSDFNNFVVLEWKRPWDVSGMSQDDIKKQEESFKEFGARVEGGGNLRKVAYPLGGIYPDCFVFPGAKFEADEFGDEIRWNNLTDEVQKAENQLGSDIVRALFARWMEEIENILDLPDGNNGPLWFQRLSLVKSNWTTAVQPPVTALNDFTEASYEVEVPDHNNNLVSIPIRHLTKNIFCEKVIKFANGKMPDLPVKSEYLYLINAVNRDGDVYHVRLKGWNGTITWTPQEIIDGDRASILLWPNFKATGWNVNYILFYPSDIFRGHNPSLSLINFDGQNTSCIAEVKKEAGVAAGCATNQEITHIEVSCDEESVGIFLDKRTHIDAGVGRRRISIDFGTTHTSLAVWDGVNNNTFIFQDMTADALDMNYYDQNEFKGYPAWLPTFIGPIKSLPSELIFLSPDVILPANLSSHIQCFTIPYFKCEKLIRTAISRFKWQEPPILEGFRGSLVKAYLKMVMHMALANLRRLHNTRNVTIVPTYPLAFDSQRYTDYMNWWNQLINDLTTETGMGIQLEVTTVNGLQVLVGESHAAKALYAPPPPTAEFVVDIGGGTTDIALLIGNNILAVDSFRYGGNLFLEYLATRMFPNPTNPDIAFINDFKDDPIGVKTIALQRAIRISGSIRDLFNQFNDIQRTTAEGSLYRFFDGLFEYLRLLLAANNLQNNIFLYLIGNGWRFIEGFSAVPNITSFVEQWFNKKGIKLIANLPEGFEWKEALAIGANKIVEQNAYDPPKDFLDKPIKTINGGKVRMIWNSGNRDFTPTDPIPTDGLGFTLRDNPRFDTTAFVASLPFRPLLNTSLDVIAARLNAECLVGMWGIAGGGVSLARSVFAKFLEKIYPEYYL